MTFNFRPTLSICNIFSFSNIFLSFLSPSWTIISFSFAFSFRDQIFSLLCVSSLNSNPADLSRLYTLFGWKSDSWHLQDFCRRPSWMSRKGRRVSRWRSRGRPPRGSACHQSWRTRWSSSQRRCPGKQGEPSTKVASLGRQAGSNRQPATLSSQSNDGQQRAVKALPRA